MVNAQIKNGSIPAELSYVFCNRAPGESNASDALIELIRSCHLPLVYLSSKTFLPALRKQGREQDPLKLLEWRSRYDQAVKQLICQQPVDVIVLAGYMLIVSPILCNHFPMLNLHPAPPGGPSGTWQEVIWQLIAAGAREAGAMMHLVTEELDQGPPVTYFTFDIHTGTFRVPRNALYDRLKKMPLTRVQQDEGENNSYFQQIRAQGVKREPALLIQTLKLLAAGSLIIKNGKTLDCHGNLVAGYCLNREIETMLAQEEQRL
jgi:phosphoribosylglycinamide formyltransferase-1